MLFKRTIQYFCICMLHVVSVSKTIHIVQNYEYGSFLYRFFVVQKSTALIESIVLTIKELIFKCK